MTPEQLEKRLFSAMESAVEAGYAPSDFGNNPKMGQICPLGALALETSSNDDGIGAYTIVERMGINRSISHAIADGWDHGDRVDAYDMAPYRFRKLEQRRWYAVGVRLRQHWTACE